MEGLTDSLKNIIYFGFITREVCPDGDNSMFQEYCSFTSERTQLMDEACIMLVKCSQQRAFGMIKTNRA